jgi:hypothetical protein
LRVLFSVGEAAAEHRLESGDELPNAAKRAVIGCTRAVGAELAAVL